MAAVIALLAVISSTVAIRFWLWGAWPVVLFSLLEVPLVVLMLAINMRRARASEMIMLTAHQLTVVRTDPSGRRKQDLLPVAWLRVDLDGAQGVPRLMVRNRGQGYEVGAFLHEPDKISLFEALLTALQQVRNPYFDNPQLRDTSELRTGQ